MGQLENYMFKIGPNLIFILIIIALIIHLFNLVYIKEQMYHAFMDLDVEYNKLEIKYEKIDKSYNIVTENMRLIGKEIPELNSFVNSGQKQRFVAITKKLDPPFAVSVMASLFESFSNKIPDAKHIYFSDSKSDKITSKIIQQIIIEDKLNNISTPLLLLLDNNNTVIFAFNIKGNIGSDEINRVKETFQTIINQ